MWKNGQNHQVQGRIRTQKKKLYFIKLYARAQSKSELCTVWTWRPGIWWGQWVKSSGTRQVDSRRLPFARSRVCDEYVVDFLLGRDLMDLIPYYARVNVPYWWHSSLNETSYHASSSGKDSATSSEVMQITAQSPNTASMFFFET